MAKIKTIGIVSESESDFEACRIFIRRITNRESLSFLKQIAGGCGKLRGKLETYASVLESRGCDLIVVVHDRDKNNLTKLTSELTSRLRVCGIKQKFVCIPVQEIEAWFLSDPKGIKDAMKLKRLPKVKGNPENITSPKQYLGRCINSSSEKRKVYSNTSHNPILATRVSLNEVRTKCPSFVLFFDFIRTLQFS